MKRCFFDAHRKRCSLNTRPSTYGSQTETVDESGSLVDIIGQWKELLAEVKMESLRSISPFYPVDLVQKWLYRF